MGMSLSVEKCLVANCVENNPKYHCRCGANDPMKTKNIVELGIMQPYLKFV